MCEFATILCYAKRFLRGRRRTLLLQGIGLLVGAWATLIALAGMIPPGTR